MVSNCTVYRVPFAELLVERYFNDRAERRPFGLGPVIIALIPTMQGDESCARAVKQLKMNVVAAANTAYADVFSIVTRSDF